MATSIGGLALRLVRDNLLSSSDAERIQSEATAQRVPFVTQLVQSKKLDSTTVAKVASDEFGVPLFDIASLDLEIAPVNLVSEKIMNRHRVLPLYKRGVRLFVAIADPTNIQALDEVKFHTGLTTEPILVEEAKLSQAIEKILDASDTSLQDLAADEGLESLEILADEDDKGSQGFTQR
jgi:type IV pilus assembly protein PilB